MTTEEPPEKKTRVNLPGMMAWDNTPPIDFDRWRTVFGKTFFKGVRKEITMIVMSYRVDQSQVTEREFRRRLRAYEEGNPDDQIARYVDLNFGGDIDIARAGYELSPRDDFGRANYVQRIFTIMKAKGFDVGLQDRADESKDPKPIEQFLGELFYPNIKMEFDVNDRAVIRRALLKKKTTRS
jgi:hypothetical protein